MPAAIQAVISTRTKFKDYPFKKSHVSICNSQGSRFTARKNDGKPFPCTSTTGQSEIGQISVRRVKYDSSNKNESKYSQCKYSGSLFIDLASYVESTSANIKNIDSIDTSAFVFNCP